MKKTAIIMGSDSDLPIAQKAAAVLTELELPYEGHIYSAHRTPEEARGFALHARENGFGAIIAIAGMAAAIPLTVSLRFPFPLNRRRAGRESITALSEPTATRKYWTPGSRTICCTSARLLPARL